MAITSFIPTVWSESLLTQLDREYIAVRNCTREFEGDIKEKGSTVKIGGIGAINVFDYTKDTDMSAPEALSDYAKTLTIDQAKAFNFQIDDIDKAQAQPKLMQAAMSQAAAALADVADQYVYSLYTEAVHKIIVDGVVVDDMLELIAEARRKLTMHKVNSNVPTALEVTPDIASYILRAKALQSTDNTEAMENGALGKMFGFDIYVSHNVPKVDGRHKCIVRTKRAVAFAEQLNEVEAYRPESRFADAVKGLHLYGAKIVYPDEFVVLDIALA
ncbi:MAG: hypothetical protein E7632_06010 [Ruminococcaceae bacterium]|nr:hypothetical protein [Oscillospiraceae bacterium]